MRIALASIHPRLLSGDRLQLGHKPRWMFVDEPYRMMRIVAELVRLAPQVDLIQLNLPTPAFLSWPICYKAWCRCP